MQFQNNIWCLGNMPNLQDLAWKKKYTILVGYYGLVKSYPIPLNDHKLIT